MLRMTLLVALLLALDQAMVTEPAKLHTSYESLSAMQL